MLRIVTQTSYRKWIWSKYSHLKYRSSAKAQESGTHIKAIRESLNTHTHKAISADFEKPWSCKTDEQWCCLGISRHCEYQFPNKKMGSSQHDCQAVLGQSCRGCYDLIYYLDGRLLRPSLLQSHPNFCLHSDKAFVWVLQHMRYQGFTLTLFWDKPYYDNIYIYIYCHNNGKMFPVCHDVRYTVCGSDLIAFL